MTLGSLLIAKLTAGLALGIVFVEFVGHGADGPRTPMGHMTEHVILFAALMLPTALFRPHWMIWMVPLACFFAVALELFRLHGTHVHGYDVIADICGISFGTVTVPLTRAIGGFLRSR